MTLTDAGPLIAILDAGEGDHGRCIRALDRLTAPMLTSWPAFTEAMVLLGDAGGWAAQDALWKLIGRGDLVVADMDEASVKRARALMARYRDVPMDLADASLVALAEALKIRRVFSLDNDFHVYRVDGRHRFEVVP